MDRIKEINFMGFNFHHTLEDNPQPRAFTKHTHNNLYEIIFFIEGKGEFLVESSRYSLLPNSLLLLRPAELHYMNISPNHPYERYVLHFSGDLIFPTNKKMLLEPFDNRNAGQENLFFCKDMTGPLLQLYTRLSAYSLFPEDEKAMLCQCLLNELLVLVLGIYRRRGETLTLPKSDVCSELIDYLDEHITEPLHLEQLAEQFFVSKFYLSHIFKERTDLPIMEYILRKRVKMAQALMGNGIPANMAASQCGFGDYTSFFRAYKRIAGVSPSNRSSLAQKS